MWLFVSYEGSTQPKMQRRRSEVKKTKKQPKTSATVTVHKPGRMMSKRRHDVASWLRRTADDLEAIGDQMTDTGPYTARYYYG